MPKLHAVPMPASSPTPEHPDRLSDGALVRAVRAGDRSCFAALVQRYNQRLFRAARGVLGSDADAEDVVQEAHVTAFRKLAQLTDADAYGGWVTRIAVRAALQRIRSQKRVTEAKRAMRAETDVLSPSSAAPSGSDPERELAIAALRSKLERAIEGLSDEHRAVFMMRAVQEATTAETADALGLSEENVRVRLHRARAALREDLVDAPWPSAYRFLGDRCVAMTQGVMAIVNAETPT